MALGILVLSGIILLPVLLPIAYTAPYVIKANETTSEGTFNELDNTLYENTKRSIVSATVMALSSPATRGRLLLLLKSLSDGMETSSAKRAKKKSSYDVGSLVQAEGYVKNVSPKGCFVMLSWKIDAKILISNLSDDFVENSEKDFPVGKLVIGGKVLSVEPLSKRVEVSLRTLNAVNTSKSNSNHLNQIAVRDIIHGKIKRVESYGLFISIDQTNVVGLCRVSELSDNHIDDLLAEFKAGERVTAKVLKVDKEKNRVSLGMKSAYIKDEEDSEPPSGKNTGSVVIPEPTLSHSSSQNTSNRSDDVHNPY